MQAKVRKAVFPAAGLGTRFLPATKAQPKEMLPIVDKPIIQYGVEEALHSGIQNIIIVTGRGKSAIEDHFDVSFELEYLLESRSKKELLNTVRSISDMIDVSYVRQKEALGLGHAVLRAMELVGVEPFSVVLADDLIEAETPCSSREHFGVRGHRCRAGVAQRAPRPRVPHPRPGGEAQAGRRPFEPGHYRPVCADSRDLRFVAKHRSGIGRRNSVDRRAQAPAAIAADLRVQVRRDAIRRRRQVGIPQGHRRVRSPAAGSGRSLPRVSAGSETLALGRGQERTSGPASRPSPEASSIFPVALWKYLFGATFR
jgi:Nucleotidyl transferase